MSPVPVSPTGKCAVIGCGKNRLQGDDFCASCGLMRGKLRREGQVIDRRRGEDTTVAVAADGHAQGQRLDPPEDSDGNHYLGRLHNTEQMVQCIERLQADGRSVIHEKNIRYAGSGDPFANLRRHGVYGIVVRMDDKIARLTNLLRPGSESNGTTDESVYDTAMDLMNYAGILLAWLCDQKGKEMTNEPNKPK